MLRLLLANGADPNKLIQLMWKTVSSSYPEVVEELEDTGRSRWKWNSCVQPYTGALSRWYVIWLTVASLSIRRFSMTQYSWGKMTSWPFSLNEVLIQPSRMVIQTRPRWKPPR
jgi:hypothetical protein